MRDHVVQCIPEILCRVGKKSLNTQEKNSSPSDFCVHGAICRVRGAPGFLRPQLISSDRSDWLTEPETSTQRGAAGPGAHGLGKPSPGMWARGRHCFQVPCMAMWCAFSSAGRSAVTFKNGIKIVTLLTVSRCKITILQPCKVLIFKKLWTGAKVCLHAVLRLLDSRS